MSNPALEPAAVLPLVEERLRVERRSEVTGRVRVRTETETVPVRIEEALSKEVVEVERVPVGRYVEALPEVRQEGETVVYPVVEEVMVKRLYLREEVRIVRHRVVEPFVRDETLIRQNAVVERLSPEQPSTPPLPSESETQP